MVRKLIKHTYSCHPRLAQVAHAVQATLFGGTWIGRGRTTAHPPMHGSKCESRGGASSLSRGSQDLVALLDQLDRSASIVPVSHLLRRFVVARRRSAAPPRRMNLLKPKTPTDLEKNGVRTGVTLWLPVPAIRR